MDTRTPSATLAPIPIHPCPKQRSGQIFIFVETGSEK